MEPGLEERTRSLRLTAFVGPATPKYMGKSFKELKLEDEEPGKLGRDISACIVVHRIAKARRLGRNTSACIGVHRMSEESERQDASISIDKYRMARANASAGQHYLVSEEGVASDTAGWWWNRLADCIGSPRTISGVSITMMW